MAELARKIEKYTTDYIESLPDGIRAELIDGVIYSMTSPSTKHQRISGRLYNSISNHIIAKGGTCEPFIAPFAVYLNADNQTYLEPDISVICTPDKLTDKGCEGAPDWIIEVVSPNSRIMDYMKKLVKYHAAGVREYWIVDPDRNRITVYNFEGDEELSEYDFTDIVKAGIFEELEIDFAALQL
ncbi:MAG: Uma2 family endonuclease [Lachnospiraceae bacterium]|nr:Uma2 family endonuclease [Lachnospiraceae bacterium]